MWGNLYGFNCITSTIFTCQQFRFLCANKLRLKQNSVFLSHFKELSIYQSVYSFIISKVKRCVMKLVLFSGQSLFVHFKREHKCVCIYIYTCYCVRHRFSSPHSFPSHLNWKKQGPGSSALGMEDCEIQVLKSSGSFQCQTQAGSVWTRWASFWF